MCVCNFAVKVLLALFGILFLFCGNRALATQWVLHRTYEAKEVKEVCVREYFDLDSIRQENGLIRFWQKAVFHSCKGIGSIDEDTGAEAGATTSFAVDCIQRKMAITTTRSYALPSCFFRSGSGCLNNFPRFISGIRAV
jgi:hypothetical protein